jgi:hypothetical protein
MTLETEQPRSLVTTRAIGDDVHTVRSLSCIYGAKPSKNR